jgi:protein SCO1/2
LLSAVFYFGIFRFIPKQQEARIDGVVLTNPQAMMNFQLTDNRGNAYSQADLQGHWTMMFFGFTNCGMVCPTTMAALNQMYKALQQEIPDNQLPSIIMVSVDPERDTVARMNEYVNAFNPNFIGLRGDMTQIEALEKNLHLVSVKMQAGTGKNQYTINHSAEIMIFNPHGQLQALMAYPHKPDQMEQDYKTLLKSRIS